MPSPGPLASTVATGFWASLLGLEMLGLDRNLKDFLTPNPVLFPWLGKWGPTPPSSPLNWGGAQPFPMTENLISRMGSSINELVFPASCLKRSKILWAESVLSLLLHSVFQVCYSALSPRLPLILTVVCNPASAVLAPRIPSLKQPPPAHGGKREMRTFILPEPTVQTLLFPIPP